ncbi:hypothetical protein [Bacillus horti]|uniref:Pimeloyl-ACP methyl ester carboxylesterase n=1 Tax=Caldalkalibacillus horti TaxID=77523 RepID=A0ABT9W1Q5_9BACI|nr:hypothetical protein [Bacillus horti]MDQ0166997.1 pimeloyl-ACP methyl ester carboxylesterase [Bacillus horti]
MGALGISHGAWVVIEAARLYPTIAFVIPVVGGGVPLWRALQYETERTLQIRGYDPTTVEEAKSSMLAVFGLLRNGDANLLASLLQQLNNFTWFEDTALARFKGLSPEVIELAAKHIWDAELSYDPLPALQNIAAPILAILAEKDDFVPAIECMKSFAELEREGMIVRTAGNVELFAAFY